MRIFVVIPHYCREVSANATNKSTQIGARRERLQALAATILGVHQALGGGVCGLDHAQIVAWPQADPGSRTLEMVICSTEKDHVLADLAALRPLFSHHVAAVDPQQLGFECHRLLRDERGKYDYYCYLEDDIVVSDPWFLRKRQAFDKRFGPRALLQPNRYELSPIGPIYKLYVDYRLHRKLTAAYQNIDDQPFLEMPFLDEIILFERPTYPSAGCFFLNTEQLDLWISGKHFLDGDTSYLKSPLDSAATLSIMKTFRIYKPTLTQAGFLEVQHASPRWIGQPLTWRPPTS
jgi:hypothetical protein